MKIKDISVIYIAGNGHSGSTLLDIILGASTDIFSAGELTKITRNSIFEEYCSCGQLIGECEVWSKVMKNWSEKSPITLEEYRRLIQNFERNKATPIVLFYKLNPSRDFKNYCEATHLLFEAIKKVTGKSVIVDSSKYPQRIAMLNKFAKLKVIHLCRNAKGVLNSAKKSSKKDLRMGREADSPVRRTSKTLLDWFFINLITEIFTLGVPSIRLKYTKFIVNVQSIGEIHPKMDISTLNQKFFAEHMLAGNALRLKKDIVVDKNLGLNYDRLTKKQLRVASLFDRIFPFWA